MALKRAPRRWIRRALLIVFGVGLLSVLMLVVRATSLSRQVLVDTASLIADGVSASDLQKEWVDILLTVEDPAFFDHPGIDLRTPGQGWTTLTQSLVKRHFPGILSGVWGKIRQSIFALALDWQMSKESQLGLHLNTAYFGTLDGKDLTGFPEAASQLYGAPLQEVSRDQFVSLVAMLVGPNHFHPLTNPKALKVRVARIESLLAGRCTPNGWRDVYLEGCA